MLKIFAIRRQGNRLVLYFNTKIHQHVPFARPNTRRNITLNWFKAKLFTLNIIIKKNLQNKNLLNPASFSATLSLSSPPSKQDVSVINELLKKEILSLKCKANEILNSKHMFWPVFPRQSVQLLIEKKCSSKFKRDKRNGEFHFQSTLASKELSKHRHY